MNTQEKVLGALKAPNDVISKLYQTPVQKMTYLNTLVFSSLDGPHGFLEDTVLGIGSLKLLDGSEETGINDFGETIYLVKLEGLTDSEGIGSLKLIDGSTKVGLDDFGDNIYLVQLEGVTNDSCYEITIDNKSRTDARVIKCSSLVCWWVNKTWVRTKDLQVGWIIDLAEQMEIVGIAEIGKHPVYSLKSLLGRDRKIVEGCLLSSVGIVNISVWVKHTDSAGAPTGNESLVIDRKWLRTRDSVTFHWNIPLDENSQVHIKADTPAVDVVAYGVELEHKDKKRISSSENIYSKTKALEPVDYGDFVKTYTVTSEQILHRTRQGYSSNVTNIVISNTTEEVAKLKAKIHTKFGDYITQPNILVLPHHHYHYRIGTSLVSTIQLSGNEGISMESNLPVQITIYGHENEERE